MMKRFFANCKCICSFLLAVLLLCSTLPLTAIAETNGDGFIEIRTIEELYNVRNDLTANYILMNDIDLTAATAAGGDWDYYGNGWNPIGSENVYSNSAFSGEFNGNGHKIIGMRISVTSLPSGTSDAIYLGLFANVTGSVHDLTFVDGSISSTSYTYKGKLFAGAVAGNAENATVSAIANKMQSISVKSGSGCDNYCGGIVGYGTALNISLCVNTSSVYSSSSYDSSYYKQTYTYSGGIVGHAMSGNVSESYNTGTIEAKGDRYSGYYANPEAGGICGYCSGNITKCYNMGLISTGPINEVSGDHPYASGICTSGKITQCYNVGNITGDGKTYAIGGKTTTDSYYLSGTGDGTTGATELTEAQMLLPSLYLGFDFETVWEQNTDAVYPYPQLRNLPQDLRVVEGIALLNLPQKTVYEYGESLNLTGCKLNLLLANGNETVVVTQNMVSGYDPTTPGVQTLTVTYMGKTVTFTVTVKEKEYTPIYTVEDLYNIRDNLSGYYILMNDIDLTAATAAGGDWDYYGNGWNPIGSENVYSNSAFSGEFNGNGHKIIGMRISVTSIPSGTSDAIYLGLFANVTGSVHDLTFEGGRISSTYSGANLAIYAGAVSGYADCAVVSKVVNAMDEIHGSSEYANIYCGGIIGCGKKVSVFLCENRATLYSYSNTYSGGSSGIKSVYAGGLLGYMVGGNISECFNTGTIEAVNYNHNGSYSPYSTYAYSAGICGYGTGTMTKCYNAGKVYANRKFTSNSSTYGKRCSAGICYSGTISQCYNVNSVTADNGNSYAIGGTTTTDSYYLSGTGNNTVGSTALTEAQMKLQSMYTGFDFENTWVLNAYAKYPYPQLKTNIQDLSDAVSVVSIISLPLKTDYLTGDALVLDGCTIEVIYASGENEIHSVSADMISGYDEAVTGEQTVTVTYGGVSDTFTVNVSARPSVVKIEMASQPTETEFLVGTSFDFSGAKILVYYADDTTETLNVTDTMTSGGNIYHLGDQTITVTYLGATVTFNVCVIPVTISCLRLEKEPNKLSYIEGQSLDLSGMELIAVMNDGTEKPITTGYAVSGYTATPGTDTVTLSYMGKSVSFQVEIQARTVVELSLNSAPDKTEYVAGQSFDPTGMKIVATYDNGDVEIVQDYAVSGFDSMPGYKTVTISYGGKYVAILITVVARVITDFQITSYPTKQEYLQYESLDLTGLTVQATYNDGTIEEVTDYEIVGFSSNVGAHTVSVAYKGWVQTFTINVSSRVLTHIVVTSPDKLTYCLGETLDTTGLTVTACYNNGQQISVDDYTISGFNSNEAGTQIVTVSYGGCTSAFSVCVSQRSEIETEGNFAVGHVAGRLGETVSIPVTVSNNTGIAGFKQTIRFDKNTLRFVSAEGIGIYGNGTWIVNTENAENGEVVIVWFGTENINENGAVYNLSFEILETAKDGNSAISITFENNDIGNISGENVLFGRIDGSVDVLSYWLGDLSGDRVYTMVDLLQLAQYVSGKQMILTDKQKLAADVNEDGNIDIHDVILLQQWLLVADM